MIVQKFSYVGLTDQDNATLHEEIVAIPADTYENFQDVIESPERHDLQTEGMIKNLLRNGAQRCDGKNGEAAVTVLHFNDESCVALYRAGGEMDAHDAPLTVMEKHFKDGKPHFTVGYNHSGLPDHLSFDSTNALTHFSNNMGGTDAFDELRSALTQRSIPASPVIGMKNKLAIAG